MKEIYFIRHSKPGRNKLQEFLSKFNSVFKRNFLSPLSKEGKEIANKKLSNKIFDDIEKIYSSDYKRAFETAKILSKRINKKIIINKNFEERMHGVIKSYDELPKDFGDKQLLDENYKYGYGESQKEVRERMLNGLYEVLKSGSNKVAIFTHSTCTLFMLLNWCNIDNKTYEISYNNKKIFDGRIDYVETFKLTFDDNNELLNIENIKL